MTAPLPTVTGVKAWLLTRLTTVITAASGHSLGIVYGHSAATDSDDVVELLTGKRAVSPLAFTGDMSAYAMQEEYTLIVRVSSWRPEGMQSAEERMWAMLALVENVVRVDMWGVIAGETQVATWGGNVFNLGIPDHEPTVDWSPDDTGALAAIDYHVTIHAVI